MQEIVAAPGGADALTEFFLDLQVWGTPEQCVEKILDIRGAPAPRRYIGVFSYAGMPHAEASATCGCSRAPSCRSCKSTRAERSGSEVRLEVRALVAERAEAERGVHLPVRVVEARA